MLRKLKFPRRRVLAAVGSVTALMVGGGLALEAARASAQTINAQQEQSQNWSGYVVQSSTGQNFSSVSGSWVEPAVNSNSTGDGYAAFWVGLGGSGQQSQSLEQVGTAAQVVNGQKSYYAWYELVPSAQVRLGLTINPGDHVSGKVTVDGTNVTISLSDQTTGQSVAKTLQMSNPDTSSAEWIAEAPAAEYPDGATQILPLANFGKVTFTNTSASAAGHTGSIGDPAFTVQQVDLNSTASAGSAGDVSDNGTSFTVSYSTEVPSTQSAGGGAGNAYGYPGYGYQGYGYGYPGYGYGYPGYGY